jgi:hypothetical protein
MRVTRNAQHCIKEQQRAMPESDVDLLSSISEPLRVELHFEMYTPVFTNHPFFKAYTFEVSQVMRKVCHLATSISLVSRGDVVFSNGEKAMTMYFVVNGNLQYTSKRRSPCEVGVDRWLSEPSLWAYWTHRGELTALQETRLFCLNAKLFQEIVLHFDHNHTDFDPKVYAQEFVEMLNSSIEADDLTFWTNDVEEASDRLHRGDVSRHINLGDGTFSQPAKRLLRISQQSSHFSSTSPKSGILQKCLGCLGLCRVAASKQPQAPLYKQSVRRKSESDD